MSTVHTKDELRARGAEVRPAVSKHQRFMIARSAFRGSNLNVMFRTLHEIEEEKTPLEKLRRMSIKGTVLAPIAEALKEAGIISRTATVGDVMDGLLVDQKVLHTLVCDCLLGTSAPGQYFAAKFYEIGKLYR